MEDDGPPGVPEWVVTYGDMMSLLLTFFIMLVSLSEVVADKKYRAVVAALQHYVGYRTSALSPPGKNFPMNSFIKQIAELQLGSYTDEDDGRGGVKSQSVEGDDTRVYRTREGSARRTGEPISFSTQPQSPDYAELSENAQAQLAIIAKSLAGKPNKIEIRAHAGPEAIPADSPYSDKLELTYHRAKAVMEFLVNTAGIDRRRMRLAAAGDVDPTSTQHEATQSKYDCAEILITDAFLTEYIGPRDLGD